eukprot:jgi/Ulvmu1/572/UM001_0580.1
MPREGPISSEGETSWTEFMALTRRSWFGEDVPEDTHVRLNAGLLASLQEGKAASGKSDRVVSWLESSRTPMASRSGRDACGTQSPSSPSCRGYTAHSPAHVQSRQCRSPQAQARRPSRNGHCRHSSRSACDGRLPAGSCPYSLQAAPSMVSHHSHSAGAGKAPHTRPVVIPEVDEEEDDGGGGGLLPVVSDTTGHSSSRLSSRLCDLEKMLSVDSDTSRTSDSAGGATKSDSSLDSCVRYTPFSDNWQPRQAPPELSPVPSCDYMPSHSSASLQDALQCIAQCKSHSSSSGDATVTALRLPRRKLLPQSACASPVVGSPGRQCTLERSVTCHAGSQGVDMAVAMEAVFHSMSQLHVSPSAELASRCLPSVTLTTSSLAPHTKHSGLSDMLHSRMESCPGPVPLVFTPVRCGARAGAGAAGD